MELHAGVQTICITVFLTTYFT